MLTNMDVVLTTVDSCKQIQFKNVQVALCSLLLNFAVSVKDTTDTEAKSHILTLIANFSREALDLEAVFRLMVCLGTLLSKDENGVALASSLDLNVFTKKYTDVSNPAKVGELAKTLSKMLDY